MPSIVYIAAHVFETFYYLFDRYFRKERLYGLACYEKMSVESEIERGARMKSVGILSTSYTLLYRHIQFLEAQVRYIPIYNKGDNEFAFE